MRRSKIGRRLVTIPALFAGSVISVVAAPLWLPVMTFVDVVSRRWRLPLVRLGLFGVQWCWIESVGILRSGRAWISGRSADAEFHYELMRWWTEALMKALARTAGIKPTVEGEAAVRQGDAIVLCRHASLIDSLVTGWAFRSQAGVRPCYVLKEELLLDPCLDVVGNRVPNVFIDRAAAELDAVRALGSHVDAESVAVIFPEGTRANPAKRERALEKIAEYRPDRATALNALRHLLPPRPAGARALLEGAPDADIVLAWHVGFDGCDTFSGMVRRVARPMTPARLVLRRVPRSEVPSGPEFDRWLDDVWLALDAEVDAAITAV